MRSFQLLILDFDGVIIESNEVKTDAFLQVFKQFPRYSDEMMAYHYANISLGRLEKFDHLLDLMGRKDDVDLKNDIADQFSRKILEKMMTVPLVAGALSFLQLATAKLPVYLASVTPENELGVILKQRNLLHWFKNVYGCPPWTKLTAIKDVLDREMILPEEVLLIGDSAGDQRAAFAAGINFIGRDSGLQFDQPAPLCFADLNEICTYFIEQNIWRIKYS